MSVRSILLSVAVLIAVSVTGVSAEPKPGDIYAEYVWRGPYYNASTWQRVTDPAAAGARQFLPNRRNRITIEDLDRAIVAEFHIEQWGATRARRTQRFA